MPKFFTWLTRSAMSHHPVEPGVARTAANAALSLSVTRRDLAGMNTALSAGADIDALDGDHQTALSVAAWDLKDWTAVSLLIARGARVDVVRHGEHLLHLFAGANQISLARAVLDRGQAADMPIADERGLTPLIIAVCRSYSGMVALLLEYRAAINLRSRDGNTPLHYAMNATMVEQLLAAGADVDARSDSGWTPLMNRASMGDGAGCKSLLEHGARPDMRSADGNTALLEASRLNQGSAVIVLLNAGADQTIKMPDGRDFKWYCDHHPIIGTAYASWCARMAMLATLGPLASRHADAH